MNAPWYIVFTLSVQEKSRQTFKRAHFIKDAIVMLIFQYNLKVGKW